MDGATVLAVIDLLIYLLMIVFALFVLLKHGRHGFEGWIFFVLFCMLRIIADGLQIKNWHDEQNGKMPTDTASIVNSVGISALLLCICGVIHEASTYENDHDRKMGWLMILVNHIIVASGIALAAIGGSHLANATTLSDRDSGRTLLIAGYFIILTAAVGELIYAGKTLMSLRLTGLSTRSPHPSAIRSALILVYGSIAAVTVLLIRIIESIVFGFTLNRSLSPFTGSLAVKVVFIFLVQLVAALFVVMAGLATRNIASEANEQDHELASRHRNSGKQRRHSRR